MELWTINVDIEELSEKEKEELKEPQVASALSSVLGQFVWDITVLGPKLASITIFDDQPPRIDPHHPDSLWEAVELYEKAKRKLEKLLGVL